MAAKNGQKRPKRPNTAGTARQPKLPKAVRSWGTLLAKTHTDKLIIPEISKASKIVGAQNPRDTLWLRYRRMLVQVTLSRNRGAQS